MHAKVPGPMECQPQMFLCSACARHSLVTAVHDVEGTPYVVCMHCFAHCRALRSAGAPGDAPRFMVRGSVTVGAAPPLR